MPKLITILWRDIPSQVVAKRGRETIKAKLSARFQIAIDRAAMRAGKGSSAPYMDEWRRQSRPCGGALHDEISAAVDRLEASFSDQRLEALVKSKGQDIGTDDGVQAAPTAEED